MAKRSEASDKTTPADCRRRRAPRRAGAARGARSAAGVNFAVFSKHARARRTAAVRRAVDDPAPAARHPSGPGASTGPATTGTCWCRVSATARSMAGGSPAPRSRRRATAYDGDKLLLDPYARAVTGQDVYDRQARRGRRGDNCARACARRRSTPSLYDWQGDRTLPRPPGREVIYEMHVRGFTAACQQRRARCLGAAPTPGVAARAEYLRDLGRHRRRTDAGPRVRPAGRAGGLTNVWGYSPVCWCAPARRLQFRPPPRRPGRRVPRHGHALCTGPASGSCWTSSTTTPPKAAPTVRPSAGAGSRTRPTTCSRRRLALRRLHRLRQHRQLQPLGRRPPDPRFAALLGRHLHVDGFRFDLASVHARGEDGVPLERPPLLWAIGAIRELAGAALIAEAWDAGGLYQVGSFPGDRFARWNGTIPRRRRGASGAATTARSRTSWPAWSAAPTCFAAVTPDAVASGQFRHLPRRILPARPGLLRPQAQRGERRGQSRRDRRQPELELRHRRRDRRSRDRRAARAAGPQFPDADPAGPRHADAAGRRRVRPHAARQQQPVVPGQRAQPAGLVARGAGSGPVALHAAARRLQRTTCASCRRTASGRPPAPAAAARSPGTASARARPDWSRGLPGRWPSRWSIRPGEELVHVMTNAGEPRRSISRLPAAPGDEPLAAGHRHRAPLAGGYPRTGTRRRVDGHRR